MFWIGTKACKKKKLKSLSWLRNIKLKKYPFWRLDTLFSETKQINLDKIKDGGWHFKNLKNISAEEILEVSEEVYAEHYFNYVDDGFSMIGNLSDTFKSRNVEKVDLLIGSNNDEWSLYFDGNVDISLWLDEETTPEKKIKLLPYHMVQPEKVMIKLDLS